MLESLVDVNVEDADPFRVGTVLSCLVVGLSYLLPWASVDGPGGEIGSGGGVVNITTTVRGTISAREIALFPEAILTVAVVAVFIVAFRWTVFLQFLLAVLGLGAAFAALVAWAVIDASGRSELLEVGPYAAVPSAFEPAIGLWFAIFGSLGLVACGFGAATRQYVMTKQLKE